MSHKTIWPHRLRSVCVFSLRSVSMCFQFADTLDTPAQNVSCQSIRKIPYLFEEGLAQRSVDPSHANSLARVD